MASITSSIVQSQTFELIIAVQETSTDFLSVKSTKLTAIFSNLPTLFSCFNPWNINSLYRLYEGLNNTDTITISSSSTPQLTGLQYEASIYKAYNQKCDPNIVYNGK